jgi:predicted alpha/beta-fold hydrolase
MSATPFEAANLPSRQLVERDNLFQPPWVLRNGHAQTLAGAYLFSRWPLRDACSNLTTAMGEVSLNDGDRLIFHDDCPTDWQQGDRVALLLHGLAGDHNSPYMPRIARQLNQRRVRTIRLDWRGCGAGTSLARYPYHSGRSADLEATLDELQRRFRNSSMSVIGFSMGGNVLLKLLGEAGALANGAAGISRAVAVCPPINLAVTVEYIRSGWARWYDRYFAKVCIRDVRRRLRVRPDSIVPDGWFGRLPRTMRDFDESFTAPVCGFSSAAAYYARCSACQFLPTIAVPTLIIAAQDDPVIPYAPFHEATLSPAVELRAPRHGGHLGFVTSSGPGWLDRQIIDWTLADD